MTTTADRHEQGEGRGSPIPPGSDPTDLLEMAVDAHGGPARWTKVSSVTIDVSITGGIWYAKGQPDVLNNVVMVADTKRERVTTSFVGQDRTTVFEPGRVVVQGSDGTVVETSDDPEGSFAGHNADTPWNAVHVAYFSGEALWTYLNTPFLYMEPRFTKQEVAPLEVEGETWRRLKVTFPTDVKSHTREQIFCFGSDGLLRRHDYTVDISAERPDRITPPTIGKSMASCSRPSDGSTPTRATTNWFRNRFSSRSTSVGSHCRDLQMPSTR